MKLNNLPGKIGSTKLFNSISTVTHVFKYGCSLLQQVPAVFIHLPQVQLMLFKFHYYIFIAGVHEDTIVINLVID